MAGPQESRFLDGLRGARGDDVQSAAASWESSSFLLSSVATAMSAASGKSQGLLGRGPDAYSKALDSTADAMAKKAKILFEGGQALHRASAAIVDSRQALHNMNTDPDSAAMSDPGPKVTTTPDDAKDPDIVAKHRTHNASVDKYQAHVDKREHISQKWADHMDTVFENSTDTMKGISGWQPPPPPPSGYDGQGTYTPTNVPSPNQPNSNPGHNHHGVITTHPTNPGHPGHPGHPGTGTTPGAPQGPIASPGAPTPGSPTGPGIGPAPAPGAPPVAPPGSPTTPIGTNPAAPPSGLNPGLTGGLVGGTVLGTGGLIAGIKNGISVPGMSTRGVGSIGSTRVSGSSSVLSRSSSSSLSEEGVAGTRTSPTSRVGGVGGAGGTGGARAGGTGSGSGGRGGRGGRGAGTGAGGRGRGKDKRKRAGDRDLFDDGQDWLDDEGAAPGVLE